MIDSPYSKSKLGNPNLSKSFSPAVMETMTIVSTLIETLLIQFINKESLYRTRTLVEM